MRCFYLLASRRDAWIVQAVWTFIPVGLVCCFGFVVEMLFGFMLCVCSEIFAVCLLFVFVLADCYALWFELAPF